MIDPEISKMFKTIIDKLNKLIAYQEIRLDDYSNKILHDKYRNLKTIVKDIEINDKNNNDR